MRTAVVAAIGVVLTMREGQAQRIDPGTLQSFVTWGDQQTSDVLNVTVPNETFVSPPFNDTAPTIKQMPGVASFTQLVDVRYPRPTSWTIGLYAVVPAGLQGADSFRVTFEVDVSVGKATNKLFFVLDSASSGTPVFGSTGVFVFQTLTVAAQTLRVIPVQVRFDADPALLGQRAPLAWAAWAAPVVE